jgi:hypothetical protein
MLVRNVPRLVLAALLLFAAATTATAGVRPWLSGSFGTSTLAMNDVNDDIGTANTALAGTGASLDNITHGLNFGGALGLDVGRDWAVGFAIDRLLAQSEAGTTNQSVLYDTPGEIVRGFARFSFWNRGNARGYLEASAGRTRTLATLNAQSSDAGTAHAGLEGTGPAYSLAAGMRIPSGSMFALSGELGYRYAKANDVKVEHEPIYNITGDPYSVDYSGVFVRAAVTLYLLPHHEPTAEAPPAAKPPTPRK